MDTNKAEESDHSAQNGSVSFLVNIYLLHSPLICFFSFGEYGILDNMFHCIDLNPATLNTL